MTRSRRLSRGRGAGPEAGALVWGVSGTHAQSPPELLPRPCRADGATGGAAVCAAGGGPCRRCAWWCHRAHDGLRDSERARRRPARGPQPAAARTVRRRSGAPEAPLLRPARAAPPVWLAASTHSSDIPSLQANMLKLDLLLQAHATTCLPIPAAARTLPTWPRCRWRAPRTSRPRLRPCARAAPSTPTGRAAGAPPATAPPRSWSRCWWPRAALVRLAALQRRTGGS